MKSKRLILLVYTLLCYSNFFVFAQKITAIAKLAPIINESSGLVSYNDSILITHNDSGDKPLLYFINLKGELVHSLEVQNATNIDWEEITQDKKGNLFIADIGNNDNKRKNLKIYRIEYANFLKMKSVKAELISFHYADQNQFPPDESQLNYDAESLVFYNDSLWIFTKNRTVPFSGISYVYSLPSKPGNYEIRKRAELFIGNKGFAKDAVSAAAIFNDHVYLNTYNRMLVYKINNGLFTYINQYATTPFSQKEALFIKNKHTIYFTDEVSKFIGGGRLYKMVIK